jgi:ubiquitin C-terminal hydrolase
VPEAPPMALRILNGNGAASSKSGAMAVEASSDAAKAAPRVDPDTGSAALLPRAKYLFCPDRLQSLLQWSTVSGAGPGLSNLGNTCFMNATLQCLTYTPPVANLCLARAHSKRCTRPGFCTYCELEGHVRAAHDRNSAPRSIAPRVLVRHVRSVAKHFRPGRQEDAHEYFICLLEAMQAAALRAALKNGPSSRGGDGANGNGGTAMKVPAAVEATSEVLQVFGGRLRSQVVCSRCKHASSTFEPYLDLSLELRNASSVTQALRLYTVKERLEGANRYRCMACKGLVNATKQLLLHRTPPVLCVQLKRFGFGRYGGGKIGKPVQFDETLDLGQFCTNECVEASSTRFRLYAVLVHEGASANAGHYYCYVRASSGVWHKLDDDHVSVVSASKVLAQKAYMLFYQRLDRKVQAAAIAPARPLPASTSGPKPELPSDSDSEEGGEDDGEEESSEEESEDEDEDGEESSGGEEDEDYDDDEEESSEDSELGDTAGGRPRRAAFVASSRFIAAATAAAAAPPPVRAAARRSEELSRAALSPKESAKAPEWRRRRHALRLSLVPMAGAWAWWRQRQPPRKGSKGVRKRLPKAAGRDTRPPPAASPSWSSSSVRPAAFDGDGDGPRTFGPSLPSSTLAATTLRELSDNAGVHPPSRTFGKSVGTWGTLDGGDAVGPAKRNGDDLSSSAVGSSRPPAKRRRSYDTWDAEIDKGHVRKTKANKEANRRAKLAGTSQWLRGGRGAKKSSATGRTSSMGSAKKWLV